MREEEVITAAGSADDVGDDVAEASVVGEPAAATTKQAPCPCHECHTTRAPWAMRECSRCGHHCCVPQCGLQVRNKCICLCCVVPLCAETTAAVAQADTERGIAPSANDAAIGWAAGVVAGAKSSAGVTIRNPAAQHLAGGPTRNYHRIC